MSNDLLHELSIKLKELKTSGLFKNERILVSPQHAEIELNNNNKVINFCANNYLGLSNHPDLIKQAKIAIDKYGFGMSSVRFICGTLDIHKQLEKKISDFLGTDDTILYSSCFDANGGLFETLLTNEDAIISDSLNHASIIDGIRLCKAKRLRYSNNDMEDLEAKLIEAKDCRHKIIATDGVFSMDGVVANLSAICDLADKYNALVMVDDCHATGFIGNNGKGSCDYCNVLGRVDIITGTLGKALGGASGGFTSGKKEIIQWLRQYSRPYLFSNTLAPVITSVSIKVFELLESCNDLREKLHDNSKYFRNAMKQLGFTLVDGDHPIIPIMLFDAKISSQMAEMLLDHGIYVISFAYPVVPQGQARIRTQMSASHDKKHLDKAIAAFAKVGKELGVI
jgi:glycine C-acetyltransferase